MPKLTLKILLISTHTPHAGRDENMDILDRIIKISTHTPHAGRDVNISVRIYVFHKFQLTRPTRGVTWCKQGKGRRKRFQLTRPTRGVTH